MEFVSSGANVAVFCGARMGLRADYAALAREFGGLLAAHKAGLVYGGSGTGIMGTLADAVLTAGGRVTGVIPQILYDREYPDLGRGEVYLVSGMHERKELMYRLSSAFAVLPGGIGTLDELIEVVTWNKLAIMQKPIVVVNYGGFFDPMFAMLDHLVAEGFLTVKERELVMMADDATDALDKLFLLCADFRPLASA
jgi:uncharacterized protein (TIGR00730 family)